MKKEEFKIKYDEALAEINSLRQKKKEELIQINNAGKNAYKNLKPLLDEFWPTIEREAIKIIEEAEVSAEDVKKDNIESTQSRILSEVSDKSKGIGQSYSERIQVEIERALDKEAERLQGYGVELSTSLDKIHNIFVNSTGSPDLMMEGIVSSTICSFLAPGFAGIWTGYRIAGVKGALVGGISGFGGAVGTGMIIAALGIPFAWPALLAMSVVSVFTGNWMTKKMFGKNGIEKFKADIKDAVISQLDEMKGQGTFTQNVREQINSAFTALKEKIETETETVLNDTQRTLDELKIKIERENVMTENEKEDLKGIALTVAKMMENAHKLNQQLLSVLDK